MTEIRACFFCGLPMEVEIGVVGRPRERHPMCGELDRSMARAEHHSMLVQRVAPDAAIEFRKRAWRLANAANEWLKNSDD